MTGVVQLKQNPSDPYQRYHVWDTGRIDALGGALPIADAPTFFGVAYDPVIALHISDWNGPSGFVLTDRGGFYPFGGEPNPGAGELFFVMPGVPYKGGISGVQGDSGPTYVDFDWDPNNTGQGYVCTYYGEILHFGGATACPRSGPLWAQKYARRFDMQWTPFKRSLMLDCFGGRQQDFPRPGSLGQTDGYVDYSRDWARDMVVTDWGDTGSSNGGFGAYPSGYGLRADGITWEFGPDRPLDSFGGPLGGQNQVGLGIISPASPLTLIQVGVLGQESIYTSSTPPVVVAGGQGGSPAAVVTDTTRPLLAFSYQDPQSDRLTEWQIVVWPQSYVDVTDMTNPRLLRGNAVVNESGTDSTTRGIVSPVDIPNGHFRMYVRAKDAAGQWSAWSNRGWLQDVPPLQIPTALLATVDGFHANLLLSVPVATPGQFAVFEYSDDAGVSWSEVRGAESVPTAVLTEAVDWDIPLGVPRTYRGRLFFSVPRQISDPSPVQTITCESYTFVLTSCDDPELGGEVFPVGGMGWSRDVVAGVFDPLGAKYPIVITDGSPRARRRALTLDSGSVGMWDLIRGLVEAGGTLVLREPFGEFGYYNVVGGFGRDQVRALASPGDGPALAHVHEVDLPLVEVAQPAPIPPEDD